MTKQGYHRKVRNVCWCCVHFCLFRAGASTIELGKELARARARAGASTIELGKS